MCKFIGKCNEWFSCKLSKSEMLSLYSIVHVAMETTKKSHFTCPSKSFISIFFTCQVSACELQSFSCHDLANDIYSQTAKTVFSHLKKKEKKKHSCFLPVLDWYSFHFYLGKSVSDWQFYNFLLVSSLCMSFIPLKR